MNSVAASGRSPRKAQRNSITPSIKATRSSTTNRANTPDMAGTHDEEPKTVQDLKDELEEKSETVERLKEKITQLEERAKYLEADARLKASMMSTEVLSLKEKARKLEIELSTIVDERDILEQEIDELRSQIVDGEDNDEARQLSVQLKDAWLRIKNMKATQEETVQNLFSSEEANAKLRAELATAVNASSTAKSSQVDERQKWNSEKQEFVAEINSFKEKLSLVSKNGGKQVLDWEEDKARLRNSFAHERSAWDKEKRGFLDQIASFKVKASTLTMQKATPPEWVLEKHKLTEQCATLQSRVTILETNRANEGNSSSSSVKKLEADKQKLQKKVEALRTKLVEVMLQMEEEEKKPKVCTDKYVSNCCIHFLPILSIYPCLNDLQILLSTMFRLAVVDVVVLLPPEEKDRLLRNPTRTRMRRWRSRKQSRQKQHRLRQELEPRGVQQRSRLATNSRATMKSTTRILKWMRRMMTTKTRRNLRQWSQTKKVPTTIRPYL
ncbi:hypothetical protein BC939DRAFT_20946 [Gamsiella multidivaricata]|uniref:uncharacterized protein n=1 Tax=Gamsiella multidivaricata TaxID=101098 RepID=UPI00221EA022|nr:uncharacterized protein BC939DRAFT_20946 [Gamsiella multidivaricata]KAI7816954.1 hypothetical protein BC939DRAFT_20946 [Gamsiella multidivaricata]